MFRTPVVHVAFLRFSTRWRRRQIWPARRIFYTTWGRARSEGRLVAGEYPVRGSSYPKRSMTKALCMLNCCRGFLCGHIHRYAAAHAYLSMMQYESERERHVRAAFPVVLPKRKCAPPSLLLVLPHPCYLGITAGSYLPSPTLSSPSTAGSSKNTSVLPHCVRLCANT